MTNRTEQGWDSALPQPIDKNEEADRLRSLKDRGDLLKALGIPELCRILLIRLGSPNAVAPGTQTVFSSHNAALLTSRPPLPPSHAAAAVAARRNSQVRHVDSPWVDVSSLPCISSKVFCRHPRSLNTVKPLQNLWCNQHGSKVANKPILYYVGTHAHMYALHPTPPTCMHTLPHLTFHHSLLTAGKTRPDPPSDARPFQRT